MRKEYTENGISIIFDNGVIVFHGEMRHASLSEFKPIKQFLWDLIGAINNLSVVSFNIEKLEYLNSSGQAILNMFLLELKRETTNTGIVFCGTKDYEWQEKFLYTANQLWNGKTEPISVKLDGVLTESEYKRYNTKAWV